MASILIIDDTEEICNMLASLLEKKGFNVHTASNGAEGIQYTKTIKFDIIISDIFMPSKDGLETITELKRKNQNVKIIAMSGGGEFKSPVDYLDIAKKLGADYRLDKPIKDKELLEIIENILKDS